VTAKGQRLNYGQEKSDCEGPHRAQRYCVFDRASRPSSDERDRLLENSSLITRQRPRARPATIVNLMGPCEAQCIEHERVLNRWAYKPNDGRNGNRLLEGSGLTQRTRCDWGNDIDLEKPKVSQDHCTRELTLRHLDRDARQGELGRRA
jgi:hypothetical protein